MNRLVIVGNGFDLAFRYKTSVEDFLTWLLRNEISRLLTGSLNESPFIRRKLNVIPGHGEIERLQSLPLTLLTEFYMKSNFEWTSKFVEGLVRNGVNKGWFEIEASYYKALQNLIAPAGAVDEVGLKKLNSEMNELVIKLKEYLLTQNEQRQLEPVQVEFLIRLAEIKDISGFKITDLDRIIFVNFNYTDILHYSVSQVKLSRYPEIIHVHGRLNGNEDESILVGYGDDLDSNFSKIQNSNNVEVAKFIKSFHYERNAAYSKLIDICEADEFTIYIVGHSCGTTDKTLLKSLVEHRNCKKIKLFHKGNYDDFFKRNVALSRYFENKQERRFKMLPFDAKDVLPTKKNENQ